MHRDFRALVCFIVCTSWSFPLISQGNVGIGTINPAHRLDIQGDSASSQNVLQAQVNYTGVLNVQAVTGLSHVGEGYGLGGHFSGGWRGVDAQAIAGGYTGSAVGIYARAIGTTGSRYGVYATATGGSTNVGVFGYTNGGTGHYGVYGSNPDVAGYAGYFNGRGHFTAELRADKNLVVDDTLWTRRIWNPSGILDVKSVVDVEVTLNRLNNPNLTGFFEIFSGSGTTLFAVNEFGQTRAHGNLYVQGNAGVGTLSPSTRLHISSGSDASFSTHGFIQTGITDGWNMVIDDNEILARNNGASTDLFIQRDGGNLLLCALELGGVGIGLTAGTSIPAGYMFAVDGKIAAEEVRIQNSDSWPDYVFSDHYQLMPISVLKQSILTNGHLPNIPSAATVAEEGILIGDMQKRMMEKIEELTLYVIDLHEENVRQQMEIAQLRTELDRVIRTSEERANRR